ncbi:low molecular weight protein-tyrosine-phosphatase [Pseudonocardia xishanensis]|uniref:protein-tyrosine-phosphatase n=1 Tax=Pseudonocardia xishanensis TaxID=630995 RepID=A0ABP8S2L6_9PSEU
MAEKVFRAALDEAGLAETVTVTSAGTGGWHTGEPMDERAAEVLRAHGYDASHVARQVDSTVLSANVLVALDAGHRRALRDSVPEPDRVVLLRSFDPDSPDDAEVPDPYYGGPDGFAEVLRMIEAAVPGLLERVRKEL